MKLARIARRIPVLAGVAAVATVTTMAVTTTVKVVAKIEKDSTADKVIDFVGDVAISTACLLIL